MTTDGEHRPAGLVSIEKAVLADACLGIPLGRLRFSVAAARDLSPRTPVPATLLLRGEQLALLRELAGEGESEAARAVAALGEAAQAALEVGPFSVTDKPESPPEGDRHDYQSLAKYWWPDPQSEDGLPWVRHDGAVNPACYSEASDYPRLVELAETVVVLALAAYLGGERRFAARAQALLVHWFLAPETRQRPGFAHAQRVPGRTATRRTALIEARHLVYITEAVQLLEAIDGIDSTTGEGLRHWFGELLDWMETSAEGRSSRQAANNIGFWFDLQCLVYARFVGREECAREIVKAIVVPRIEEQLAADGRLPQELGRENPADYVAFTIAAMALLGRAAGDAAGEPLWSYRDGDGRGFQAAHDWLLSVARARTETDGRTPEPGAFVGDLFDLGLKLRALTRIADERRQQLATAEAVAREQAEQARQQAAESVDLRQRLEAAEREAVRWRDRLDEAEQEGGRLRGLLDTARDEESRLRGQLDVVEVDKKRLRERLDTATGERERLRAELEPLSAFKETLSARDQRIATLEKRLRKLEGERDRLAERLEQRDAECRAMRTSRSWRLTRPLRAAVVGARRLGVPLRARAAPPTVNPEDDAGGHYGERMGAPPSPRFGGAGDGPPALPAGAHEPQELRALRAGAKPDETALQREYVATGLDREADTFVLYRIIGNDLHPRHAKGQTRANVRFILEHEPDFPACTKRWVLNRIIDANEEARIIELLEAAGQAWIRIPFVEAEYRRIGFDLEAAQWLASAEHRPGEGGQARLRSALYRAKNNYVMNNNGARNAALAAGRHEAKWVLPWDGNCFLTRAAWDALHAAVTERPWLRYFVVPMTRVTDNERLLDGAFEANPVEEPQLLFRRDAQESFNEAFCYGRRPKVELFWRLAIPGKWDRWRDDPWDPPRRERSREAGQYGVAGWVARLNSGMAQLEQHSLDSFKQRGRVRQDAILETLMRLDAGSTDAATLTLYDPTALAAAARHWRREEQGHEYEGAAATVARIVADADEALARGPYSVVDKTSLPPSGDRHDYWHPAPYWWPNPDTADGLPYVQRDGERVPGTRMYEPESERYDRTRLQRLVDDSTALALAWYVTGDTRYAEQGARLLRCFFLDPKTRMNPHLEYAQVRRGHNGDRGAPAGLIEFKDLYYYLDAARLLCQSGTLGSDDIDGFRGWLEAYLEWLHTSRQGGREWVASNNHGICYDLQVAAIAAFIDDRQTLYDTLARAQTRLAGHFADDGSQPEELKRTTTAHYCTFNLQSWLNCAALAATWGVSFDAQAAPRQRLYRAIDWLLATMDAGWPYQQIDAFDPERLQPIRRAGAAAGIASASAGPGGEYTVRFFPHDGIPPYWLLSRIGCGPAPLHATVEPTDREAGAEPRQGSTASSWT